MPYIDHQNVARRPCGKWYWPIAILQLIVILLGSALLAWNIGHWHGHTQSDMYSETK